MLVVMPSVCGRVGVTTYERGQEANRVHYVDTKVSLNEIKSAINVDSQRKDAPHGN